MDSAKSWLLEQYPNHEKVIHELWGSDKGFQAASHALQELQLQIDRLSSDAEPADPGELEPLRHRRSALQREVLLMMGANMR